MLSKKLYQNFWIDILILTLMFVGTTCFSSYRPVYTNENHFVGKIYANVDELPEIFQNSNDEMTGVFLKPDHLLKDVSFLCLGSTSKAFLAEDIGFLIGIYLKKIGVDFCISGFPVTLSPDSTPAKDFISSSPYVVSQILELYYLGLIKAGILPVIDGTQGFNERVIFSLRSRGIYLPVLILEDQLEEFSKLNYDVPILVDKAKGIFWCSDVDADVILKLDWSESFESWDNKVKELREEIIKSAIVLVKRGKVEKVEVVSSEKDLENVNLNSRIGVILINNPYLINEKSVGALVIVFSNDKIVLDEAIKVLNGLEAPTGKVTWTF